ncbi:uncharacterized mitochondrial protein-like protein, partial [Tanacetum coccineum]
MAAQGTSTNKLSTIRSSVSTATTPYVCTASTPSGANASESSFVYFGRKIPIDASTLPNADLPIDPNMPDLEDSYDAFSNDGIFNGAYDDENVGAVADFNNVDDIIFGSIKKFLCTEFKDCMHKRFQMSSMGELTFFLGLQVKQQPDGIFISQDKYVADILNNFDFWSIRTASTPIKSNKPLVKDEDGEDVDIHVYRSMIGSLMYLTASRPDIMFVVFACARFQVTPKASHLNTVKRIF